MTWLEARLLDHLRDDGYQIIAEAKRQGFPQPMIDNVLDAIQLHRRGTFTDDDFRAYIEGEGKSPLTEWFNGDEKQESHPGGLAQPERG